MKNFIIYPVCVICGENIKRLRFGKCPNWKHFHCLSREFLMKLLANVFLLLLISCSINNPVSPPQNTDIPVTNALVIYSKSVDDNYDIPQNRKEILSIVSDYYSLMSYDKFNIKFIELLSKNNTFFINKKIEFYKNQAKNNIFFPFQLYNQDLLTQVVTEYDNSIFEEIDFLVIIGTDGGKDWYKEGVDATGVSSIGINFSKFERSDGITIEISKGRSSFNSIETTEWILAHEIGHYLGFYRHRPQSYHKFSLMTINGYIKPNLGPTPLDPFYLLNPGGWIPIENIKTIPNNIDTTFNIILYNIREKNHTILLKFKQKRRVDELLLSYHQPTNRFDKMYDENKNILIIWNRETPIKITNNTFISQDQNITIHVLKRQINFVELKITLKKQIG